MDEEQLGQVYLIVGLEQFRAALIHTVLIALIVIILAGLVAFLLSRKLQLMISDPILNLANFAKTVSDSKDYTMVAEKESDDEIGNLVDAFNEMLAKLRGISNNARKLNRSYEQLKRFSNRKWRNVPGNYRKSTPFKPLSSRTACWNHPRDWWICGMGKSQCKKDSGY